MIAVSDAWKNAHKQKILPETFVEIEMLVGFAGSLPSFTVERSSSSSGISGYPNNLVNKTDPPAYSYFATLEENLWVLDGTRNINSLIGNVNAPQVFYSVSDSVDVFSCLFDEPVLTLAPGMRIVWSSEYNEYPTMFRIEAYLGDTVVDTATITGNDSHISNVELKLTNFDKIILTLFDWNMPNHRKRIEAIAFGVSVLFDKNDILSYTHEQSGDLLSDAMPKNSITFSVSNVDGKWNLYDPSGMGRYLTERQKMVVRYGMDLDGIVEWIPGGTFFLSEWDAPSNGLEAKFVACDILSFFINVTPGSISSILETVFPTALSYIGVSGISSTVDYGSSGSSYSYNYSLLADSKANSANQAQYLANMNSMVFYTDRDGNIHAHRLNNTIGDYVIPLEFAYSHPEIMLSKPLKEVSVKYIYPSTTTTEKIEQYVVRSVNTVGEKQTVENPYVSEWGAAYDMATYAINILRSRKTVSGEFRADPRLDVFDVVEIESKYGTITPVAITNIKYVYNGSFRGYYEGRVITI